MAQRDEGSARDDQGPGGSSSGACQGTRGREVISTSHDGRDDGRRARRGDGAVGSPGGNDSQPPSPEGDAGSSGSAQPEAGAPRGTEGSEFRG
eukprot:2684248-Pyramimonas_sp.AAC.1